MGLKASNKDQHSVSVKCTEYFIVSNKTQCRPYILITLIVHKRITTRLQECTAGQEIMFNYYGVIRHNIKR